MRVGALISRALAVTSALSLVGNTDPVRAATSTATFTAQIIIEADCQVLSPTTLDFGTVGALTAAHDATSTFSVQCTNTTPYNIGLNQGTTSGGTTATRKMTSGSATIDYRMYSDSSHLVTWGNTI